MAERNLGESEYSKDGFSQAALLLKSCLEPKPEERGNASLGQQNELLVKEGLLPELGIGDRTDDVTTGGIAFGSFQKAYLQAETEFHGFEDGGRAVLYGIRQRLGQPLEKNELAYLYAVRQFKGIDDGGRAVSYSTRERLGHDLLPEEKVYLQNAERLTTGAYSSNATHPKRVGEGRVFGPLHQEFSDDQDPRQYPALQSFRERGNQDPVQQSNNLKDRGTQDPQLPFRNRESEHRERKSPDVMLDVPSLIL